MLPITAKAAPLSSKRFVCAGNACVVTGGRFREAFLALTNKDMYNTAPFWGVHLGTTTIMDPNGHQGGSPWGHTAAAWLASSFAGTICAPLELAYRRIVTGVPPSPPPHPHCGSPSAVRLERGQLTTCVR